MKSMSLLTSAKLVGLSFVFIHLLSVQQASAQGECDCEEYIYINESADGGRVHKFRVDGVNALTEIGAPWFESFSPGGNFPAPHGLGTDLNGFLYIGESFDDNLPGVSIRRFDCDGNVAPESEFNLLAAPLNTASIGNDLYYNNTASINYFRADLCTQTETGEVCLADNNQGIRGWALYVSPDDVFYTAIRGNDGGRIYAFTDADFDAAGCVDPLVAGTANNQLFDDPDFTNDDPEPFGITTDPAGNIYIVVANTFGDAAKIMKFDANGNFITETAVDDAEDGVGWFGAVGIVYSETTNSLYVTNNTTIDPCVSTFDLDLNYLGAAVSPTGPNSSATGPIEGKTVGILKECCPATNNVVIDTVFCGGDGVGETILLQDFYSCDGIICQGSLEPTSGNFGISYDDCARTITIDSPIGCGTYDLVSDGVGTNSQCGPFTVTVNVKVVETPTVSIAGDQTLCPDDTPTPLAATASSSSVTYQWQMSTASCTGPWVDIPSATADTYTPPVPTATTYYQVVVMEIGTACTNTGSCDATSNCVTLTPGTDCCPAENCFDIVVTRN